MTPEEINKKDPGCFSLRERPPQVGDIIQMLELPATGAVFVLDYSVGSKTYTLGDTGVLKGIDMVTNCHCERPMIVFCIYRLLAEPGRSTSP